MAPTPKESAAKKATRKSPRSKAGVGKNNKVADAAMKKKIAERKARVAELQARKNNNEQLSADEQAILDNPDGDIEMGDVAPDDEAPEGGDNDTTPEEQGGSGSGDQDQEGETADTNGDKDGNGSSTSKMSKSKGKAKEGSGKTKTPSDKPVVAWVTARAKKPAVGRNYMVEGEEKHSTREEVDDEQMDKWDGQDQAAKDKANVVTKSDTYKELVDLEAVLDQSEDIKWVWCDGPWAKGTKTQKYELGHWRVMHIRCDFTIPEQSGKRTEIVSLSDLEHLMEYQHREVEVKPMIVGYYDRVQREYDWEHQAYLKLQKKKEEKSKGGQNKRMKQEIADLKKNGGGSEQVDKLSKRIDELEARNKVLEEQLAQAKQGAS